MGAEPIGVLIVNDSPVAGQTIRRILLGDARYRVIGIAPDGYEAERRIMAIRALPILIVTATVTRNMDHIFECLRHGALEVIRTPGAPPGSSAGHQPGAAHLLERMA